MLFHTWTVMYALQTKIWERRKLVRWVVLEALFITVIPNQVLTPFKSASKRLIERNRVPNRVLTLLKSGSKRPIEVFVQPSKKRRFWNIENYVSGTYCKKFSSLLGVWKVLTEFLTNILFDVPRASFGSH